VGTGDCSNPDDELRPPASSWSVPGGSSPKSLVFQHGKEEEEGWKEEEGGEGGEEGGGGGTEEEGSGQASLAAARARTSVCWSATATAPFRRHALH